MKPNTEIHFEMGGCAFVATGWYHPPVAGRYSGPPESCYPDEPAEFEIETVSVMITEENGKEAPWLIPYELLELELTKHVRGTPYDTLGARLTTAAIEAIESDIGYDERGDDE